MTRVLLDLSRLVSRVRHATPSGVDRVEMAYARGLERAYGNDLVFAAVHPAGLYGHLDRAAALDYLDMLEARWSAGDGTAEQRSIVSVLPWMARLRPVMRSRLATSDPSIYVQVSPHHLTRPATVRHKLAYENARFLCMVHDLIPIEYPEYARPEGAAQHERRMETLAHHADALIFNSAATMQSFAAWATIAGRQIAGHVALLGTEALPLAEPFVADDGRPHFICVSTIEGRKNHLLLLNLWRQLAATLPTDQIPRLVIVGRRGWENEQVLDMLDRCAPLRDHVTEVNACSDQHLAALLRGARALLMPSFAEGYGMPVAEALSVGVPVICSDIPAHREVGSAVPEYIDPLDGPGWRAAILDHAQKGALWQAQARRLTQWHQPTWDDHMAVVQTAVAALADR